MAKLPYLAPILAMVLLTKSSSSTDSEPQKVPQEVPRVGAFARHVHGWSWQAFSVGMGTGAVYVTLSDLKQQPPAVRSIEAGFYFFNIALFLVNCSTLLLQAVLYPRRAWMLLNDPVQSIFAPLIVLSFATIIIGTPNYVTPKGYITSTAIYDIFWVYVAASLLTCIPMIMIWFNKPHDLTHFTPACAFLIFPMMLIGVVASSVLKVLDPADSSALAVLLTGYFFQGLGFFMSLFFICIYVIRTMMTGFPEGQQANGAFICCGPPGFTALALITLGDFARKILSQRNLVSPIAGEVWYDASVMAGFLLLGLAAFFFVFGAIPYGLKMNKNLHEILGCWAVTFPNGWISTVRLLGDIFELDSFIVLHLILTILMCLSWTILFILTVVAFLRGDIFASTSEDVIKDSPLHPKTIKAMIQKKS